MSTALPTLHVPTSLGVHRDRARSRCGASALRAAWCCPRALAPPIPAPGQRILAALIAVGPAGTRMGALTKEAAGRRRVDVGHPG